jgi:hypothetical protein
MQGTEQFLISNDICLISVCPTHPPPPTTVASGTPFKIYVAVFKGVGIGDPNYTGTARFSSSDPSAVLPAPYKFQAADMGERAFSATLFSLGPQTVVVSDPVNGVIPGTLTVTVTGPAASPVPDLTIVGKIVLALLVALVGGLSSARASS